MDCELSPFRMSQQCPTLSDVDGLQISALHDTDQKEIDEFAELRVNVGEPIQRRSEQK